MRILNKDVIVKRSPFWKTVNGYYHAVVLSVSIGGDGFVAYLPFVKIVVKPFKK